jgi:hypothetical protein
MSGPRRLLPAWAAMLALLAACSAAHYERPNTTPEQLSFDREDCARSAARESYFNSNASLGVWTTNVGPYPGSMAWQNGVQMNQWDRERELAESCMRSRGYQLAPDSPPVNPTP